MLMEKIYGAMLSAAPKPPTERNQTNALKIPIIRSKEHLSFIASLPCCISGTIGESQACHIRTGWFGMGIKPGDNMTVPLHWAIHRVQHSKKESTFWDQFNGIESAKELARMLYEATGDTIEAVKIINLFRRQR